VNEGIASPFGLGALVLTALFYWLMLRAGRRLRFLMDQPTCKTKGVFIGQVEVSGRAVLDQPLVSHLAEQPCVWFSYTVSEEWERWETETYTQNGKTMTRTVRRSGWNEIDTGGAAPAFFLEDETGRVLVDPEGADLEPVEILDETVTSESALYYGKGPAGHIPNSTGRRQFTERALLVGTPLFVAGRARERPDAIAPLIASERGEELFLITTRGEDRVQGGYRWRFWLYGLLTLLFLPAAAVFGSGRPGLWPIGLGLALAFLWLAGWFWMSVNSLIALRNRTAQGWSLIDVQLKRRADLIPRLVEVVGGLQRHESSLQADLATLRAQAVATPPGQPGPDIASTSRALLAVAERYPELKASDAFLRLQRELADTETRVALARDYYNAIATHLNTRLEIVPDRWFAPLAGLRAQSLLVAESFERTPVAVRLA
jgi:hypothetical protein